MIMRAREKQSKAIDAAWAHASTTTRRTCRLESLIINKYSVIPFVIIQKLIKELAERPCALVRSNVRTSTSVHTISLIRNKKRY